MSVCSFSLSALQYYAFPSCLCKIIVGCWTFPCMSSWISALLGSPDLQLLNLYRALQHRSFQNSWGRGIKVEFQSLPPCSHTISRYRILSTFDIPLLAQNGAKIKKYGFNYYTKIFKFKREDMNEKKKKTWIRIVVVTVMTKAGPYYLQGLAVSATSIIRFNAPNCSEVMPLMWEETEP